MPTAPHGELTPHPKQLEVVMAGSCPAAARAKQRLFLEPRAADRKLQENRGSFHAVGPNVGQHHHGQYEIPPQLSTMG